MSAVINSYVFNADFSSISTCLFAIQAVDDNGGFADDPEAAGLLAAFYGAILTKLYNTTLRIYGLLEGAVITPGDLSGDFEFLDFEYLDFYEDTLIASGDFGSVDFSGTSFSIQVIDPTNGSYSSRFRTILNIFAIFEARSSELSLSDIQLLNSVFVPVMDAFTALQIYLDAARLNPCQPVPVYFNNSAELALQGAGSDGSNGIAQGIHLRWGFAGNLGANHLAQGNYYAAGTDPSGYNKPDDFVRLSRTPYINPVVFLVDLELSLPAIDYTNFRWTYILTRVCGSQQITNIVRFNFMDQGLYKQAAQANDPNTDYFAFLQSYSGPVNISIDNKAFFSVGFDFRQLDAGLDASLRLDGYSATTLDGSDPGTLNIRQVSEATGGTPVTGTVAGDNIGFVQYLCSAGGFLQSVSFETYADFEASRQAADWTAIGNGFALSTDTDAVYEQLESSAYPVDQLWPQYRDGTTVRVANYQDKWSVSRTNDPSIMEVVQQYLVLSETDPRAQDVLVDEGLPPGTPGMLISYLDMLNVMAADYHWARMLGLGYIDTSLEASDDSPYIYKVTYVNRPALDAASLVTYVYNSLPTGRPDNRLPETPVMRGITYAPPSDSSSATGLFDANGYANFAAIRIINIGREAYDYELATQQMTTSFNVFQNLEPVFYGIEYRPAAQPSYVKPGITSTPVLGVAYNAYDTDNPLGVLETVLVPDDPNSLYIHQESQDGVHYYAIYGVNLFSRPSALSAEAATGDTEFPVINNLQPPSGIAVQYIQEEDPLVFTTATEQGWLSGRSAQFPGQPDVNYTRITFNWLDITDISYVQDLTGFNFSKVLKPQRVRTAFKAVMPLQVGGVITAAQPVTGTDSQMSLLTGSYALLDGTLVSPQIADADISRFLGSLFTTPEGQFIVTGINNNLEGLSFTIQKIIDTTTVEDTETAGLYGTVESFIMPAIGSRFTVVENLSEPQNWDILTEEIQLVNYTDPSSPVLETTTDDQGNVTTLLIGGISGVAVIAPLLSTVDQTWVTGYYSVTFDPAITLAPHPQVNLPFDPTDPGANVPGTLQSPEVLWYNGLIRVLLADGSGEKKQLPVITINQTSPLQVYVYDATYQDSPIQVSTDNNDPVDGVNYHPGYKAYVYAEPLPGTFNDANILPADGSNNKKTLVGLQSVSATDSGVLSSPVSSSLILLARLIIAPVQLAAPTTFGLKVRPDATTKAAFTFDIKVEPAATGVASAPFGFQFYRTNNEDILEALYQPDTITSILAALEALTEDDFYNQRYLELSNIVYDPANPGVFNVYDAVPAPYGFPVPDKAGLTDPDDSQEVKTAKYTLAVTYTLLPLTAQTPIFSFIKTGYQTANSLPVIKTIDGSYLDPSDPSFDPFPMIRKYVNAAEPNATYVRFTDYTLNGSSRFLYFYAVSEVSNQLAIGPLSLFAGPVTILNTIPADAPIVRYFTLGPPGDPAAASPLSVTFYLSPFSPEDTITKVRVFRTLSQNTTVSLQSMGAYIEVPATVDTVNGIVVEDDFSDMATIPFGSQLYYRLAFIRTIINERELPEDVLGLGSAVETITLIDTVNPQPPAITYDPVASTLTWPPTANLASYYLYNQNSSGNWTLVYTVTPVSQADEMVYTISPPLVLYDGDGNRIYYRYKVKVQNASGLLNLTDNIITI
jgi:hypothetical protein